MALQSSAAGSEGCTAESQSNLNWLHVYFTYLPSLFFPLTHSDPHNDVSTSHRSPSSLLPSDPPAHTNCLICSAFSALFSGESTVKSISWCRQAGWEAVPPQDERGSSDAAGDAEPHASPHGCCEIPGSAAMSSQSPGL